MKIVHENFDRYDLSKNKVLIPVYRRRTAYLNKKQTQEHKARMAKMIKDFTPTVKDFSLNPFKKKTSEVEIA